MAQPEDDTFEIPFPYEPYPQQKNLMRALHAAISASKSGCFESPTGTGKSLSVICAAMYWQQQEETRIIEAYHKEIETSAAAAPAAADDWLADILQGDSKSSVEKAAKQKKGELDRFNDVKTRIAKAHSNNDDVQVASSSLFGGGGRTNQASTSK